MAMGFTISPKVANLFMKEFESTAISISPNSSRLWFRDVDYTFVIQQAEHSLQFLQHINFIDPHAQFTKEKPSSNGSILFLDTLFSPGPNNILLTSMYRKPTYMSHYLCWNSHHILPAKYSVFNTLTHRARVVSANKQLLQEEDGYIRKSLHRGKYPNWALDRLQTNKNYRHSSNQAQTNTAYTRLTTTVTTKRVTSIWWSHTSRGLLKSSRMHVARLGSRYILKEEIPPGTSVWFPKTGIKLLRTVR